MNGPLLIIPTYISSEKQARVLLMCMKTLRLCTDERVFIIDDGSDKKWHPVFDKEISKLYDNVNIFKKEENSGFSSTVNYGIKSAIEEDRDVCLINADIEFKEKHWLDEMRKTEADIIGALLFYPNLFIQHAGIYFSKYTRNFNHRFVGSPPNLPAAHVPCECPVTGALQYIRKDCLRDIGLYDETFKMGFEDVDFNIRALQKGYKSLYNPKIKAVHHESLFRSTASQKVKDWEVESLRTLFKKYKDTDFHGMVPTMFEGL